MHNSDQKSFFMQEALAMAKIAYANHEVPVGAVIVNDNVIIGRGCNELIKKK